MANFFFNGKLEILISKILEKFEKFVKFWKIWKFRKFYKFNEILQKEFYKF